MEGKRVTVVIPERKDKIEKIKAKYKNPEMTDDVANKIATLEVANTILKSASAIVGVIFVIDLIIPDPVLGLDEIALGALTGIASTATGIINNKINDLATTGTAEIKQEEIANLANQISRAASRRKGISDRTK